MSRIGTAQCIAAIALILISSHALEWRTGKVGAFPIAFQVRMGLRSIEACSPIMDGCQQASFSQVSREWGTDPADQMFLLSSTATYGLSLMTALALLIALIARWRSGVSQTPKLAATSCGALMLAALMTGMSFSGDESMTLGWAFWASLVGGGLGLLGSAYLLMPEETYDPKELAAVMMTRPAPTELPRATAVDSTTSMLRFVAAECTIDDVGLEVSYCSGGVAKVMWADIVTVVARQLPPDPPYQGKLLFDIVTATPEGAKTPIRFMPTTRANYGAMPDGAGTTSMDNFRRLARLILERNTGVTFAADFGQFLEGSLPRRFNSMKEFQGYDSRFG